LHIYSDEMISDFNTLSEKIGQLAELTQSLRSENADLRIKSSALAAENAELTQRMQEAHARVAALLDKMPAPEQNEQDEAAA
jgi:cell division protein ZapB